MSRFALAVLWRALAVIVVVTIPLVIGLVRFVAALPLPTTDISHTDAIVVLTGGSDRISTGINLLAAGRAERLFVSGVHPGVGVDQLLRLSGGSGGRKADEASLAGRIDLGDTAGDTFGNSVETVQWMRANRFHSMRLVTADYHMPRALIEFRMEAPDLVIVANPVHPPALDMDRWWRNRASAGLLAGEYGKYLIAKWRYLATRLTSR